ncbi:hypothetical protein ON010_g142 [Phytophthora cinnamomi]|nr:hypothetical protein ON010_g142 [Phytophthora cinnamomi]
MSSPAATCGFPICRPTRCTSTSVTASAFVGYMATRLRIRSRILDSVCSEPRSALVLVSYESSRGAEKRKSTQAELQWSGGTTTQAEPKEPERKQTQTMLSKPVRVLSERIMSRGFEPTVVRLMENVRPVALLEDPVPEHY